MSRGQSSPPVPEAVAAKAWMCRSSVRFGRASQPCSAPPYGLERTRQGGAKERKAGARRTRRVCRTVWPRSPSRRGGCACRCTGCREPRRRAAGLRAGRATSRVQPSRGTPPSAARARRPGARLPFPHTTGARPSHHRRRTSVPSLRSSFPSSFGRLWMSRGRCLSQPCSRRHYRALGSRHGRSSGKQQRRSVRR